MPIFKFEKHAQNVEEATAKFEQTADEKEAETKASTALMLNRGSSGTKVLAKTEAYNKWLAEVQKRNPFIGKSYMEYAPEYAQDSEEITQAEAMADNEAAKILEKDAEGQLHIKDDYDPNAIEEETDADDLGETTRKFMDMCVVEKVVATRLGWDFDAIMEDVSSALMEEHSDDLDFELPDDLNDMVQVALQSAEAKAQLTYQQKTE